MIHNMVQPETLKEQWSGLVPKIRDRWPNLTDQDLDEINGDLNKLVAKISEKHGQNKVEVMNDLTTLITPPEKTTTGGKVGFEKESSGGKR